MYGQPPGESSPQYPPQYPQFPQYPQQPGDPTNPYGMPPAAYPPAPGYPPPQAAYGYPAAYPGGYGMPAPQQDKGAGLAITGFVLGIISMIAWLLPICGVPISIPGIILSALGRSSTTRRTLATWGLVLSIIALVLAIGNAVLGVMLYANRYRYAQP